MIGVCGNLDSSLPSIIWTADPLQFTLLELQCQMLNGAVVENPDEQPGTAQRLSATFHHFPVIRTTVLGGGGLQQANPLQKTVWKPAACRKAASYGSSTLSNALD